MEQCEAASPTYLKPHVYRLLRLREHCFNYLPFLMTAINQDYNGVIQALLQEHSSETRSRSCA